jgi:pyrroline-5-carboxylate reductase
MEEGPALAEINKRLASLDGVVTEKVIDDFVPLGGIDPANLGLTQDQLEELATADGLPRETLNTLIAQRRIALVREWYTVP